MSDRKGPLRSAALMLPLALLASGCSAFSGAEAEADHTLTVGTTGAPERPRPDRRLGRLWELYRNVYQTLLGFPSSSTAPAPEAARACGFTDAKSKVYRCTLRNDLTFSDGNKLDAAAVRHSIERVRTIGAKSGPAALLGSLDKIETKGGRTVVFRLKRPDATLPFILSTPRPPASTRPPARATRCARRAASSAPGPTRSTATARTTAPNCAGTATTAARSRRRTTASRSAVSSARPHGLRFGAGRRRRHLPRADALADHQIRERGTEERGRRRGDPAERDGEHRDPPPRLRPPRPGGAQACGPPRLRPAHRPQGAGAARPLPHGRPALFDGPWQHRRAHQRLPRRPRRAGRRQGAEGPRPGRRPRPHHFAAPVPDRPLRRRGEARIRGDQAAVGGVRTFRGRAAGALPGRVPGGVPRRRVPGLRPRLVGRLPRGRQLRGPLRRTRERHGHPVHEPGAHREAAAGLPQAEQPRCGGRRLQGGPTGARGGREAAAAVAGAPLPRVGEGRRRHRVQPRPGRDHAHLGAAREVELAAGTGTPDVGARRYVLWCERGYLRPSHRNRRSHE